MKILIAICLLATVVLGEEYFIADDPRVNVLGTGFDILENDFRQSFFVLKSKERADPDKKILTKYLPEGVIMRSTPMNEFEIYANVIDKNGDIKDSRKIDVDGSGGFLKIGGSFSGESKIVKEFISRMNHKVTKSNTIITIAGLELRTSQVDLVEDFQRKIFRINDLLTKNTIVSLAYATYDTNVIIASYGTHYIEKQIIGGILSKIDAVDISSFQTSVEQTLSASAKVSYSTFFKISGNYQLEHSDIQKYQQSVTSTKVITRGGTPWKMNNTFTYDTWVDSVATNPDTIGLHAGYILDLIDTTYFKNLTEGECFRIRALFQKQLETYYRNNFYMGCNDPTSSNYVSYANVFDPKLCNYQATFHFGGMYTTSNNGDFQVPNILTQTFSCPAGFETKPILHLEFQGATHSVDHCHEHCYHKWFKKHCDNKCWTESWIDTVTTNTFVCISNKNQTNGVYFGGIFTNNIANDITQDRSCPEKYTQYPIYHDYAKTIVSYICMAPNDIGRIVAIPFGGIFSSQDPNYLVGNTPVCSGGFERHSTGGIPAELSYCIRTGSLSRQLKALIPPGYGSTLNELLEFFPLYDLDNGTVVAIKVDPFDPNSYYDQVVALSLSLQINGTISNNERRGVSHKMNGAKRDISGHESYLLKWIEENGIYEEIVNEEIVNNDPLPQSSPQNVSEVETNKPAEQKVNPTTIGTTSPQLVKPLIAVSIVACVLFAVIIIIAIIIYRKKSKLARSNERSHLVGAHTSTKRDNTV